MAEKLSQPKAHQATRRHRRATQNPWAATELPIMESTMSTSLRLPSEADSHRVRSAEVKDGHLLPALDGSYARGHSNELAHPLVDKTKMVSPKSAGRTFSTWYATG